MAPISWLTRTVKSGSEFNSAAATILPTTSRLRFTLDLASIADFQDSARTVNIRIEVMPPGEQEWEEWHTIHWIGGSALPKPGQTVPKWEVETSGLDRFAGGQVRVHASSTSRFRWGLMGELLGPE